MERAREVRDRETRRHCGGPILDGKQEGFLRRLFKQRKQQGDVSIYSAEAKLFGGSKDASRGGRSSATTKRRRV